MTSGYNVVTQKYDLSTSRYRQIEQDEVFHEKPAVTLDRLRQLEHVAEQDVAGLEKILVKG
jgi:type I restriction enzyme M protein